MKISSNSLRVSLLRLAGEANRWIVFLMLGFALVIFSFRLLLEPEALLQFVGACLLIWGGQICLWSIGVRLEILGTVPNIAETATTIEGDEIHSAEESASKAESHQTQAWNFLLSSLEYNISEAEKSAHHTSVEHDRFVEIQRTTEALLADAEESPYAVLIILTMELERVLWGAAEFRDLPAEARFASPMRTIAEMKDRGYVSKEVYRACGDFWNLRNAAIHSIGVPAHTTVMFRVVDLGTRLMRLLAATGSIRIPRPV